MTGMQITPQRETIIDFTQEYFPADPSAFMALTGIGYPSAIAVVGAQGDTLQAQYVTDEGWALATFESPEDAVEALHTNEISAFVGDQAYLEEIMALSPGTYELVTTEVVIGGGVGLGIREATPSLLTALNLAITSLKVDGTLDTLIGLWFDGRDPNYRGG